MASDKVKRVAPLPPTLSRCTGRGSKIGSPMKFFARPRGFTLIELLVVIGIIAILVGILLPTISKARASSYRVACRAQLKDIGNVFQMYLQDSRDRLPRVNPL